MMDKLKITIYIANRPYPLNIKREEEEDIRKAVTLIDEHLQRYADNFAHSDKQDLLAMVTLQYVLETVKSKTEAERSELSLNQRLQQITELLDPITR